MYKKNKTNKTGLSVNTSFEGETIEEKIRRITNNKEPITDGAPITYTERKDGVKPEYNIRTDRWELAVDAMDTVSKQALSKREQRQTELKPIKGGADGGTDTTAGGAPGETATT